MLLRALLILLAVTAATPAPAQPLPDHRVLRVVPFADLATLDPVNTTAGNVQSHAFMVYDFLFGRTETQEIRPQMVETWSTALTASCGALRCAPASRSTMAHP